MSGKLKQAVLVSYFFKISKASLIFGLVFFQMSLKEAPFAMLQDPGSIVASIDGFATFAVRAFLSLHFWSAFSLVAFRFCLLSSRAASEKFKLPDLFLVVLAQLNYDMQ